MYKCDKCEGDLGEFHYEVEDKTYECYDCYWTDERVEDAVCVAESREYND